MSRLTSMVEKWNKCGDVPRIERDMALEELRRIYDELLDYEPQQTENSVVEEMEIPVVEERVAEVNEIVENEHESVAEEVVEIVAPEVVAPAVVAMHEDLGDAFDDALDIDALLGLTGEDSIEEAETAIFVDEVAEEPIEDPEKEPIEESIDESIEEPVEASIEPTDPIDPTDPKVVEEKVEESIEEKMPERPIGGGLFDIDDIPVRTKRGRKMISLYDAPTKPATPVKEVAPEPIEEVVEAEVAEPEPTPVSMPTPAPAPAPREEEAPQRLGDIYAKNTVTTLADKMAEEQPTAAYNRITDIRKAIGLNDKFLMIRDLFGGDANLYEDTINHLNEYDDLDECMIFIVENFRWNPDSEGAKLLVSLLERKLS